MLSLRCSFDASVGRSDLQDYVQRLEIDVWSYNKIGAPTVVGRIAAKQVLWDDAESDEESLLDICDNDSYELCEAYSVLMDKKGRFRRDLRSDDLFFRLLLIQRVLLHPDVRAWRKSILATAMGLVSESNFVLTSKKSDIFTESDFAALGFRKIVNQNLIYRDPTIPTDFGKEYPAGEEIEFTAAPHHAEWVRENW